MTTMMTMTATIAIATIAIATTDRQKRHLRIGEGDDTGSASSLAAGGAG
jgi:hypothetical protein